MTIAFEVEDFVQGFIFARRTQTEKDRSYQTHIITVAVSWISVATATHLVQQSYQITINSSEVCDVKEGSRVFSTKMLNDTFWYPKTVFSQRSLNVEIQCKTNPKAN